MKIVILSALTFLLSAVTTSADFPDTRSRFRISADVSRYRGDSSSVYVEVYYSFDVTQLKFVRKGDAYESELFMSVYFARSAGDSIVARQGWRIPFSITDTLMLQTSRNYVDVFGFFLKPDVYRLFIVGKDMNDAERGDSISVALNIPPVEQKRISLSDLELCTSIVPMEKDSANRFYKNTFEVKPNPSKVFGTHQPVIFYYVEAYNLLKNVSDKYYTKATIANAIGKEVISVEKIKRRLNESNVEVGTVKVNTLRTGAYTFSFTVIDSVDSTSYTASKKFFIYNPELPAEDLTAGSGGTVLASEYAAMSEAELDREFDLARYIATRDETAQYKKLQGADAKRKSLFEFWSKREIGEGPGTIRKQEYLKRLDYANQHFKTGFKEGWKTDRGRVFIVYGPPDEVERHANEIDVKPYEVWFYNSIQGGVTFIFGDRTGFSDYLLLHSTHRDELHDETWMRQLQAQ